MSNQKVLELAQRAGFNWPEISTTTIEERLERFAALIEQEMREVKLADEQPTTAVVRQLVEALEQLMSIVKIHSRATSNNFAWAEMDFAKEALAAAKEAGL